MPAINIDSFAWSAVNTRKPRGYYNMDNQSASQPALPTIKEAIIPSAYLEAFIDSESKRTGHRPFYKYQTQGKLEIYTCSNRGTPRILNDADRDNTRTAMKRQPIGLDCNSKLWIRYDNLEDVGCVGPDIEVTVQYNNTHSQACLDRTQVTDGMVLSKHAKETLDSLILTFESDSNLLILRKYVLLFVVESMRTNLTLKTAAAVYNLWEMHPEIMPRNVMLLKLNDINNARARLSLMTNRLASDDATSVELWTEKNKEVAIFYQRQDVKASPKKPFVLVFGTPDMFHKWRTIGHKKTVIMDATFGTNHWRFSLTTFMILDEERKGYPVAWALHSNEDKNTLEIILNELAEQLGPDFYPSVLLIDDALAEIAAFESCTWAARGTILALCIWHVKRSFAKNMILKVQLKDTRILLMLELTKIIYARSLTEAETMFNAFMVKWETTEPTFVTYVRKEWADKLHLWVIIGRKTEFSDENVTTSSAIERYHGVMKANELGVKARLRGRRIDWLIYTLLERVAVRYIHRRLMNINRAWLMGKISDISDASHSDRSFDHDGSAEICAHDCEEASALQVPTMLPVQVRSDLPKAADQVLVGAEDLAALHVAIEDLRAAMTRAKSKKGIRRATISVQRAISYLNEDDHVLSSTPFAPFLANEGDDSLKRQDPAIFGGARSGKRQKMKVSANAPPVNAPADARPDKFVGVKKSGKKAVGRSIMDRLHASSDHKKSSVISSGAVKGVQRPMGQKRGVRKVRRVVSVVPVVPRAVPQLAPLQGSRSNGVKLSKGVHGLKYPVVRVVPHVTPAVPVPPLAPSQGAAQMYEPNSNVDNRCCFLCGAVRGTYGHSCSICKKPICSAGFAVQNNCPIMENPDGSGIGCNACFKK